MPPDDDPNDSKPRRRQPSPRQLGIPRKQTIPTKKITRKVLADAEIELDMMEVADDVTDEPRPRTRADCSNVVRPCPWVSCKYHLYLDVSPSSGAITFNRPDLEPHELAESCSLDVAERGGLTLDAVGHVLSLTRERIRQIEIKNFSKLRAACMEAGIDSSDLVPRDGSPLAEAADMEPGVPASEIMAL